MQKWSDQEKLYMAWLFFASMPQLREQTTKKDFADFLGVHVNTLKYWENKPGFDQAKEKMAWVVFDALTPQYLAAWSREMIAGKDTLLIGWGRYMKPIVEKLKEAGYFEEVLPNSDGEYLDGSTLADDLKELPPDQRDKFVHMLKKARVRSLPDPNRDETKPVGLENIIRMDKLQEAGETKKKKGKVGKTPEVLEEGENDESGI